MAAYAPPASYKAEQPRELISDATQRKPSRTGSSVDSTHKGVVEPSPIDKEQGLLAKEVARDEEEVEIDRRRRHEVF